MTTPTENLSIEVGEDYPDIRDSVRRVCADFPGIYWRKLEEAEAYPTEFVSALTKAGYLGALIPEAYGGSGMPLRAAARRSTISAASISAWARATGNCTDWF